MLKLFSFGPLVLLVTAVFVASLNGELILRKNKSVFEDDGENALDDGSSFVDVADVVDDQLSERRFRRQDQQQSSNGPSDPETTNGDVIWLSSGVLSNLQEFFDNLRTNVDSINKKKFHDEYLYGKHVEVKDNPPRSFIHGIKPSSKIRKYVQSPELGSFKGTNRHDPSLKLIGLGKRNLNQPRYPIIDLF